MISPIEWKAFREEYSRLQIQTFRRGDDTESRLNIVERLLNPRFLDDLCSTEVLHQLHERLLAGETGFSSKEGETNDRPRSPHTVKGYMKSLVAALRWAEYIGMIPEAPNYRHVRTSKLRQLKGRPLTGTEFEAMLEATASIVGQKSAASWQFTLRGLWTSGLRLNELLHVHWKDSNFIRPMWLEGTYPILRLPSGLQKNNTDESIPLLPEFEDLLLQTSRSKRAGWAFHPLGVRKSGKPSKASRRLSCHRVSKVISSIGRLAGVVVSTSDARAPKFASAHDLRRSCAERLVRAGVPEREVACILRHSSVVTTRKYYAIGDVQNSASVVRSSTGDRINTMGVAARLGSRERFLDRRWLEESIAVAKKMADSLPTWSSRVEAVKQCYLALSGSEGAFPWGDATVVETWGQLPE